jgi:hypothetical protein
VSPVATTLAARWRGAATGALTATLSLVAHTAGGGALPSGSGAALLAVMAATLGALAATMPGAATAFGLFLLLASGQVIGHLLLDAAGHQHAAALGPPSTVMVVGHVAAVFAGAALIAAATRLADALSRAVHAVTAPVRPPVFTRPVGAVRSADQPLRSALALAASVSHRGPPVERTR